MTHFHLRGTGLEDHSLLNEDQVAVKKKIKQRGRFCRASSRRHKFTSCTCWCSVGLLSALWLTFLGLWLYCNYFEDGVAKPGVAGRNVAAQLIVLPQDVADETGAYCLDGSPPSYYYRNASSEEHGNSWIVHLHGSGFCYNDTSCAHRSTTHLGSSRMLPQKQEFHGMLSADVTVNPDFYDWNAVVINYCDGASFSGNRDEPALYNNTKIYYRGARVLDTVMNYLLHSSGLVDADRIILSGDSAGGLAVYLHGDHIRSLVPDGIPFKAMADGGFFLDERNVSGGTQWQTTMRRVYDMQHVQGTLDEDCLLAKSRSNKWECFFPEYAYPYVTTPLFILNSVYDPWVQWNILNFPCPPSQCSEAAGYLEKHRQTFLRRTDQVNRYDKDGMFISSCYSHCQAVFDDSWSSFEVAGATARQAFADWYFDRTTPEASRKVDCDTGYNCNPTCAATWTRDYNTSRLSALCTVC